MRGQRTALSFRVTTPSEGLRRLSQARIDAESAHKCADSALMKVR